MTDAGCPHGKIDLFISNQFAWDLYEKLIGQVIVAGMGDILGVKFEAIQFIFEVYQVKEPFYRQDLFEKILLIDSVRLGLINADLKKNKSKKKQ